jgi:hypothetical protein
MKSVTKLLPQINQILLQNNNNVYLTLIHDKYIFTLTL